MRLIAPLLVLALLYSLGVVAQESAQSQDSFPKDVTELSPEEPESLRTGDTFKAGQTVRADAPAMSDSHE